MKQTQGKENPKPKTKLKLKLKLQLIPILILILILGSSCGYTLQTSQSPLSEKEGIRKIYIKPLVNNTYKVGVENMVFNALLKNIVSHRRVSVVGRPEEADAILEGTVGVARYSFLAGNTAPGLV